MTKAIDNSLVIIKEMQKDVQYLIELTQEMKVSKEKEINYYDEILELIAKLQGDHE